MGDQHGHIAEIAGDRRVWYAVAVNLGLTLVQIVAGVLSGSLALIADGVQTFLIRDHATGETLESFAVIAGEALSHDIRAEMTLLREELDMLKRAFRRHWLETT